MYVWVSIMDRVPRKDVEFVFSHLRLRKTKKSICDENIAFVCSCVRFLIAPCGTDSAHLAKTEQCVFTVYGT